MDEYTGCLKEDRDTLRVGRGILQPTNFEYKNEIHSWNILSLMKWSHREVVAQRGLSVYK